MATKRTKKTAARGRGRPAGTTTGTAKLSPLGLRFTEAWMARLEAVTEALAAKALPGTSPTKSKLATDLVQQGVAQLERELGIAPPAS